MARFQRIGVFYELTTYVADPIEDNIESDDIADMAPSCYSVSPFKLACAIKPGTPVFTT